MGANPHNFINKMHSLVTGEDPNSGTIILQRNAIIKLEQLSISNWRYIKEFLIELFYYCMLDGNILKKI